MSDNIIGKFHGRDWLTIQEWSQEDLQTLIDAAIKIKKLQKERNPHDYLLRQTLFMIFFNRSLRTRNSFEAGMTQMGGHAHFLSPQDVLHRYPAIVEEDLGDRATPNPHRPFGATHFETWIALLYDEAGYAVPRRLGVRVGEDGEDLSDVTVGDVYLRAVKNIVVICPHSGGLDLSYVRACARFRQAESA